MIFICEDGTRITAPPECVMECGLFGLMDDLELDPLKELPVCFSKQSVDLVVKICCCEGHDLRTLTDQAMIETIAFADFLQADKALRHLAGFLAHYIGGSLDRMRAVKATHKHNASFVDMIFDAMCVPSRNLAARNGYGSSARRVYHKATPHMALRVVVQDALQLVRIICNTSPQAFFVPVEECVHGLVRGCCPALIAVIFQKIGILEEISKLDECRSFVDELMAGPFAGLLKASQGVQLVFARMGYFHTPQEAFRAALVCRWCVLSELVAGGVDVNYHEDGLYLYHLLIGLNAPFLVVERVLNSSSFVWHPVFDVLAPRSAATQEIIDRYRSH